MTILRRLSLDDAVAVQAVQRAAGEMFRSFPDPRVAACADHDPMTDDELAELAATGRAWVVADDDRVIGFLAVRVLDGCAHVEEVSVDPAHGRRGHATALLGQATAWAVARDLPAVTLTTFRDVAWNRPFYERRGYRVVADGERSPAFDRLLDEEESAYGLSRELRVLMRLDLPSPRAVGAPLVRDAVPDDLPPITQLFNALIPTTTIAWRDDLADEAEMVAWFSTQQEQGSPVLVAEVGGAVVGYTTWAWFRGGPRFPGYRHTRELTIHVAGDQHGRGVGRVLIEALLDRACAADVRVLVAGVDAANEASIRFHERLGFVEVARMPEVGRKFDRWLDLVLLQRVIR